jgi:hypothetical protein
MCKNVVVCLRDTGARLLASCKSYISLGFFTPVYQSTLCSLDQVKNVFGAQHLPVAALKKRDLTNSGPKYGNFTAVPKKRCPVSSPWRPTQLAQRGGVLKKIVSVKMASPSGMRLDGQQNNK